MNCDGQHLWFWTLKIHAKKTYFALFSATSILIGLDKAPKPHSKVENTSKVQSIFQKIL